MFKLPVKVTHQGTEYVTDYEGSIGEIAMKLLQDTSFYEETTFAISRDDIPHDKLLRIIRVKLAKRPNVIVC